MALPTRIYLTGFMGSGKSTLGPMVANVVGYDFMDLDAIIEAMARKPIPQIFADDGEVAFRALEAQALRLTTTYERMVVSLGGGALTFEANLQCALAYGTVIYLRVPLDMLVQRLYHSPNQRPLLRDADGHRLSKDALREKVAAMMDRRAHFYERAHLVIDVGPQRVGVAVDEVVRALRRRAD